MAFKRRTILAQIQQHETVVGAGVELSGNLESAGNIQINGAFSGIVKADGDVIVSASGRVDAPIDAKNATIAGIVNGNINVLKELDILETGKVFGDITCKVLSVQPGAAFSGRCVMHTKLPEQEIVKPTYEIGE